MSLFGTVLPNNLHRDFPFFNRISKLLKNYFMKKTPRRVPLVSPHGLSCAFVFPRGKTARRVCSGRDVHASGMALASAKLPGLEKRCDFRLFPAFFGEFGLIFRRRSLLFVLNFFSNAF